MGRKGIVGLLFGVAGSSVAALTGIFLLFMAVNLTGENAKPTACSSECDQIGAVALEAYQRAAEDADCEIDWTILAGIGQVESHHGTIFGATVGPDGVVDPPILGPELDGSGVGGNTTPMPAGGWSGVYGLGEWMRAVGPMQFLPSTWDIYGNGGNPHSIFDAAAAAGSLLCTAGIEEDVKKAIYAYNHSHDYVAKVLYFAAIYGRYGGEETHVDAELVDDDRVCMSQMAEEDLRDGIVDPRLVVFMQKMAEKWPYCISILRTGHATCVINTGIYPDCRVSNHWYGRAVDVSAVNRELVTPNNLFAKEVVRWIEANQGEVWMPDSVGSPWGEEFGFTDELHQDHLHIAFYTDGTMNPVGIDDDIEDRPDRPDNTRAALVWLPGVDWYEAAEAEQFDEVWTEPLPAQVAGGGVSIGEQWRPDLEDTAPEYEHRDDWRRPTRDRPDDLPWGQDEGHGIDGGLIDLQRLIDATGSGATLRLKAGRYSTGVITGPIRIVGPIVGQAVIVDDTNERAGLAVIGTSDVILDSLRVEGGRWGIYIQFSDVDVRAVTVVDASDAGVEARGSTIRVRRSRIERTGIGIGVWTTTAVIDDTVIAGVGDVGLAAVDSDVAVSDSTVANAGRYGLEARGQTTMMVEHVFVGSARSACVQTRSGASLWIRRSVLWSCAGHAISEAAGSRIAEWTNAIVDGEVSASWSALGWTGAAARNRLGAPWIGADGEPTRRARAVLGQIPDTRSDDDRDEWPSLPRLIR